MSLSKANNEKQKKTLMRSWVGEQQDIDAGMRENNSGYGTLSQTVPGRRILRTKLGAISFGSGNANEATQ